MSEPAARRRRQGTNAETDSRGIVAGITPGRVSHEKLQIDFRPCYACSLAQSLPLLPPPCPLLAHSQGKGAFQITTRCADGALPGIVFGSVHSHCHWPATVIHHCLLAVICGLDDVCHYGVPDVWLLLRSCLGDGFPIYNGTAAS